MKGHAGKQRVCIWQRKFQTRPRCSTKCTPKSYQPYACWPWRQELHPSQRQMFCASSKSKPPLGSLDPVFFRKPIQCGPVDKQLWMQLRQQASTAGMAKIMRISPPFIARPSLNTSNLGAGTHCSRLIGCNIPKGPENT